MNKTKQPTGFREKIEEIMRGSSHITMQGDHNWQTFHESSLDDLLSAISELVEECMPDEGDLYPEHDATCQCEYCASKSVRSEQRSEIRQRFKEALDPANEKDAKV